MGRSSVFSLEQVYRRQLTKNWTDIFDPFIYVTSVNPASSAGPAFGYFAGGRPQPMSKVQRVDYANDTATASPRGNMAVDINRGGGQGNMTQGYTFGGESPSSRVSSVYKVDYANDTATAGAKGPLSSVGNYCASIGNSNNG